jgi:ABC-type Fe3+-siderophore transport system permease subunit
MKIWSLIAAGAAITIFWTMLSMIFESVVFRNRSGWEFLPWYFCDIVATIGGIATFAFVYLHVMRKKE